MATLSVRVRVSIMIDRASSTVLLCTLYTARHEDSSRNGNSKAPHFRVFLFFLSLSPSRCFTPPLADPRIILPYLRFPSFSHGVCRHVANDSSLYFTADLKQTDSRAEVTFEIF